MPLAKRAPIPYPTKVPSQPPTPHSPHSLQSPFSPHSGASMSKVFTPDEVRRGRVPHVEAFTPLANAYRAWLPSQPWFAGGILLGSVLHGTHTRRSDIDLVITYKEGCDPIAMQALKGFRRAQRTLIPVNINLWSENDLKRGQHTIGHGFYSHLTWAVENGGLIGENPLAGIRLKRHHGAKEDLESYILRNVRKLREFSCENGDAWTEAKCHDLGKVGMVPPHAARRWLSLHGHADNTLHKKADVVRLLNEHLPSAANNLRTALVADAAYAEELSTCLIRYDQHRYINALQRLSGHVGGVLVFLKKLGAP